MNVVPQFVLLRLLFGLDVRLLKVHYVLNVLLFQVRRRHLGPVGAIRPVPVVVGPLLYLVVLDVAVDVERRVLLLLLLQVFVFEGVRVDRHLVVEHVDVALPPLLVLVQVVQELLVVCVALADLLLLLVVVAVVALADCFAHHLVVLFHVYVSSKPLDINDLALALLAHLCTSAATLPAVVVTVLEELLFGADDLLAAALFFEALVDELAELDQGVLDEHRVLVGLPLRVDRQVRRVRPPRVAPFVSDLRVLPI